MEFDTVERKLTYFKNNKSEPFYTFNDIKPASYKLGVCFQGFDQDGKITLEEFEIEYIKPIVE